MKTITLSTLIAGGLILFLPACKSNNTPRYFSGYTYSGVSFGKDLSDIYKKGIRDGCETAKGTYTKSHRLFNQNIDYYEGWFLGRNRCRHLLIIEEPY